MDIQISPQLKQVMTMATIFHLELLQLTNEELATTISDKLLENPFLQIEDCWNGSTVDSSYRKSYEPTYPIAQKQDRMVDYLLEYLPLQKQLPKMQEQVLNYLIHHLDEHLFLTIDVNEVSKKFSISEQEVMNCIEILQSFEPFGIATKNTRHFLEVQVNLDPSAPPFALPFVQQELKAIAELSVPYLMKKYKLSKQEVLATITYIKTLQPFPKYPTLDEPAVFIIPDMEISLCAGEWIIEMNNQLLPNVSLNESYVALIKGQSDCKSYVEQHLKDALLLLEGIAERKKTLYRIMNWLLKKQSAFLEKGPSGMNALRLVDAANDLSLHESTISRAIRNKYVRTPYGTLSLKDFFPKGMLYKENLNVTSERIKQRIEQLIAEECSAQPLSDQQLVEYLMKENIHISRRTVAKYRESLYIPNSMKRTYI